MLSPTSRILTRLSALSYLLVGTVLFLAPGWGSGKFAWNVSPFVLMTIGGWCLGNAVFAWHSAHIWRWASVYPSLIYLWLFGIFEVVVMLAFRDKVNLGSVVASGYVLAIGINAFTAIVGILDFLRLRPNVEADGRPVPAYVRGLTVFFTINLGILAVGGLLASAGGLSTEGGIFPEPLTLFSVRAFAAFFAAICLSALPLTWARNLTPMYPYGVAGVLLIIPILIAALVNLDKFDLSARPGGLLYLGAYVIVLTLVTWGLWRYRPTMMQSERIPG